MPAAGRGGGDGGCRIGLRREEGGGRTAENKSEDGGVKKEESGKRTGD
jgi:hypothetical protein